MRRENLPLLVLQRMASRMGAKPNVANCAVAKIELKKKGREKNKKILNGLRVGVLVLSALLYQV